MDSNCKINHETPMWSETRWAGCFNPEQGVGLFLHAGRLRGNLNWWWAQTVIYLPDGRVAVERSWVQNPGEIGVKTASLDLRAENEGWSASFDGIVELTSTEALSAAPRGSAAPSVQAKFELTADGSRPWWDMFGGAASKETFADMHVEQVGQCKGKLMVGSESYSLDGVSYYDHSSGVRDWSHNIGHHFAMIAMPDHTIHAIGAYTSPTEARIFGVWFTKDGKQLEVVHTEMPRLMDISNIPKSFDWPLQTKDGELLMYHLEVMHSFPATITEKNDNINGIFWEATGDPIFLTECQVKVTAPDGAVGYGHLELSNRRSFMSPKKF